MTNDQGKSVGKKNTDLKERLFAFICAVLDLLKKLPRNQINLVLGRQVLRSATSSGANYEEADGASTRKEFSRKVDIAKQELKETMYWLRLLRRENSQLGEELDALIKEADELIRIFATIVLKASSKDKAK